MSSRMTGSGEPPFVNSRVPQAENYPGMPTDLPPQEIYQQNNEVFTEKRTELGNSLMLAGFVCIIIALLLFFLMR